MTKRQKKMIEKHKKNMFHMRVFGLDWQATHQKRWGEDSLCWEGKCDCKFVKGTD
tara:strand:- start:139 stop:303 length:165 start_codon:yes stop_codon:yes gene_type:complete